MKVTIAGIGLIGGSLALALRKSGFADTIYGVEFNKQNADRALELGIVDDIVNIEEGVSKAGLIVLATPVHIIEQLAPKVLDLVQQQVVIDVGSTKSAILEAIKDHENRGRFVGTHPMAGTEYSGPDAALADLFHGKCTVIVDREHSDKDAMEIAEQMYDTLEMKRVYHHRSEHDMHAAYVSHISHISSLALALTVLEKEKNETRIFELAGGGFSSTVRLAKSNPDTWIPIFEQNRDHCLDVIDEHINTLSRFRSLLIKRDFDTFYDLMTEANHIKKILK